MRSVTLPLKKSLARGRNFRAIPKNPFAHAGYENIFTGPDGRLWLSCHGILAADPKHIPFLMIEPLDFDADGNVIIPKPDTLWHEVPIPNRK